jgi:ABC-type multidrug transport system ATPase subunit
VSEPAIALGCAGVIKRYGTVIAVDGLDLTVRRGECFGLLGPNGAGKTTTIEILEGLLDADDGAVTVLGQSWKSDAATLRPRLGIQLQETQLAEKLTVEETLRLFRSFYPDGPTVDELLDTVELKPKRASWVSKLSGGQKQRLSVACALAGRPELLFLDEPTTGLDPVNARVLKDLILEQRERGKSIFLTTHNMHDAEELCHRVAFLVDGEIKLTDEPKKLRSDRARRRVVVEYLDDGLLRSREVPLDDLGRNQEFLDLLREREIVSLHSQEPTLEDLFIQATGRKLT